VHGSIFIYLYIIVFTYDPKEILVVVRLLSKTLLTQSLSKLNLNDLSPHKQGLLIHNSVLSQGMRERSTDSVHPGPSGAAG
jgi:hypothetical protein